MDFLQNEYRSAAYIIDDKSTFLRVGRAEAILTDALAQREMDVAKVIAAARFIYQTFYSDLTGRYVPPSMPDHLCRAVSDAVLSVAPAATVVGPTVAAKILCVTRQSIDIRQRHAPWPLTPLWRADRRVYLRAELDALQAGEEAPYDATV